MLNVLARKAAETAFARNRAQTDRERRKLTMLLRGLTSLIAEERERLATERPLAAQAPETSADRSVPFASCAGFEPQRGQR